MNYPFRLGRMAIRCPRCGHREFKPFVDAAGRILDPTCGRCNRELKCGYFLPPSRLPHRPRQTAAPAATILPPPHYIDPAMVQQSMQRTDATCPLALWFGRHFGADTARWVFDAYRVGVSRLYGGSPVFWLTDGWQRTRSGKIMAYGPDARRRRTQGRPAVTYVHSLLPDATGYNYRSCLFGAHLRSANRHASVLLVESEKTALYLACCLHRRGMLLRRYIPMATGGCACTCTTEALRDPHHRFHELAGATLVMLPDADATDKWTERREGFARVCASVRLIDLRTLARTPTDDIMDIILRRHTPPPLSITEKTS